MRLEFVEGSHTYVDRDTGRVLPGITDLLKRAGIVDDQWYTAEGQERGSEVHRLTADYDLGLLGCAPGKVAKAHRGYLLGHVQATSILRPSWSHVEEVIGHERLRFAGRPDRVGMVYGAVSVFEVKTGAYDRSHMIQTALQAILVAPEVGLPPEAITRYVEYLQNNGKWKVEQFRERRDFAEANELLRRFSQGRAA